MDVEGCEERGGKAFEPHWTLLKGPTMFLIVYSVYSIYLALG